MKAKIKRYGLESDYVLYDDYTDLLKELIEERKKSQLLCNALNTLNLVVGLTQLTGNKAAMQEAVDMCGDKTDLELSKKEKIPLAWSCVKEITSTWKCTTWCGDSEQCCPFFGKE